MAGHAHQEVGKVDAGFCSRENKAAIELRDRAAIDLVGMELSPELHGVLAHHFRDRIRDLIGVVDLNELVGRGAGGVSIEVEVLDPFSLGIEGQYAGRAIGILEALRREAYAQTAHGLPQIRVVAHIAEVQLVDHGGIEGLGKAERSELGPACGDGIESRHAGPALRHRIRVIEIEVVDEVITGEQAQVSIRIDADGPLVITHDLVER